MFSDRRFTSAAVTAVVWALVTTGTASSASARTQAAAPASATTASGDGSSPTVTIFGKKRAPDSIRSFSQISARSSGSCSYMTADAVEEQITDDYLSGSGYDTGTMTNGPATLVRMHGEGTDLSNGALMDPRTGTALTDPSAMRPRINDRAVFGDASQSTGDQGSFNPDDIEHSANMTGGDSGFNVEASSPGGCTTADATGSAGRNFIARKDTDFKDAMAAYDAKDYVKARDLFEKSYTKLGYPEAALMLAQMYMNGLGTPADPAKAIAWLKRVAEEPMPDFADRQRFDPANPYAIDGRNQCVMTMARLYMTGDGVEKNPREARKWFMRADEGGYVPATYDVGLMFESGYGGDKNPSRALARFSEAAKAGFAPAQYHLGQLYYTGGDGVAQDKTKAGAWLLAAATNGYPDALYSAGRMYELGEGGAKVDLPKAAAYYKAAAIRGQPDAQTRLATYLYNGEGGTAKNPDIARKLFLAAANQGDPDAMFNLAVMMVNGEGGPKDLVRAYCWFSLAQKAGFEKAGAALQELSGKMTADERAQAEALLNPPKPTPKS